MKSGGGRPGPWWGGAEGGGERGGMGRMVRPGATQGQMDGLFSQLPYTKRWHLWEIDLRFALKGGWCLPDSSRLLRVLFVGVLGGGAGLVIRKHDTLQASEGDWTRPVLRPAGSSSWTRPRPTRAASQTVCVGAL